jgi:flagella basal body P-ring formation protein FlgA
MSSILFLISSFLFSAEKEIPSVEKHLLQVVTSKVQQECGSCRVEMEILNKQVLEDISVPDQVIADHWKGQTNLLLKLGKESRLVTTKIRWKDDVVIAKKNIRQGKVLGKNDIKTVEKDVTFLQTPYLNSLKSAKGMTGRRLFKRGEILDESLLRRPIVVKFGQPLELVLKKGDLQVQMMGKARGAGAIGDRIPVFIGHTRTKVFAKILNKNQARVE